jgi:hypothetical protein
MVLTEVDALGRLVPVMRKSSSLRGVEGGKETSYSIFSINSTLSKNERTFAFPLSTSNGPDWIGKGWSLFSTVPFQDVAGRPMTEF